jgi:hypothetical protein
MDSSASSPPIPHLAVIEHIRRGSAELLLPAVATDGGAAAWSTWVAAEAHQGDAGDAWLGYPGDAGPLEARGGGGVLPMACDRG